MNITKNFIIFIFLYCLSIFIINNSYSLNDIYFIKNENGNYILNKETNKKIEFYIKNIKEDLSTIKLKNNTFLSANLSNSNFELRENSLDWEKFKFIKLNTNKYNIKTHHSTYINIDNNGNIFNTIQTINPEILILENATECDSKNRYFLKTRDGMYLQYSSANNFDFIFNNKKDYLKLCITKNNDNSFSIKIRDKYLSANNPNFNNLIELREWSADWEKFKIISEKNNLISIKTFHNRKLSLQKNSEKSFKLVQSISERDQGELFYLIPEEINDCEPENLFYLRSLQSGKFLQKYSDNSLIFTDEINNNSKICIEKKDYKNYSFKFNDLFLSANKFNENFETRTNNLDWESFTINNYFLNQVAIQTSHGTYIDEKNQNSDKEILKQSKNINKNFQLISVYPNFIKNKIETNKCYFIKKNKSILSVKNNYELSIEHSIYNYNSIFCIERDSQSNIYIKNLLTNKYLSIDENSAYLANQIQENSKFISKSLNNGNFILKVKDKAININNQNIEVSSNKELINSFELNFLEVNPLALDNFNNEIVNLQKLKYLNLKSIKPVMNDASRLSNFSDEKLNVLNTCPLPRIGTYQDSNGGLELYCIKLPLIFGLNLPENIKEELVRNNITNFDIYLNAQNKRILPFEIEGFDNVKVNLLRAHYWIDNLKLNGVKINKIPNNYTGTIFNRNLLMTVFSNNKQFNLVNNADINDDLNLKENFLKSFNVHLHDNSASPNNALTTLAEAPNINFSFYSLIIDPITKKSAVTLHWLIEGEDFNQLQDLNRNKFLNNSYLSLAEVLAFLKSNHEIYEKMKEPITALEKLTK
ncbi:hypothetical protein ACWNT8_12935 [Pigmentibacter ruber]